MNELKIGILLSYLLILITNISGLFSTSLIVKNIDVDIYGIYIFALAVISIVSLLDAGISSSVTRFISGYRAEKNYQSEIFFISEIFKITSIICLLVLSCCYIVYIYFDSPYFSNYSLTNLEILKKIWPILTISLVFSILGNIFSGYCFGLQKFVYVKSILICKVLFKLILIYFVFLKKPDLYTLVYIDLLINLFFLILVFFYSLLNLKLKIKFIFSQDSSLIRKDIYKYSSGLFIFLISTNIQWQLGQILCAIYLSSSSSAVYGIGIMLGTFYGAFASAISGVFLAKTTQSMVLKQENKIDIHCAKVGSIILLILSPVLIGFYIYGELFIKIWAGESYIESWYIAILIMIFYTPSLILAIASQKAEAMGLFRFRSYSNLFTALLGLSLSFILLDFFNIFGVLLGMLIGLMLNSIILIWFYIRKVNMNFNILKNKILKVIKISSICFLINYPIGQYLMQEYTSWFALCSGIFVYVSIYTIIVYFHIFRKDKDFFEIVK